jgi:hypothetical protein
LRGLNGQKYFNRMANCRDCLLVARTILRNRLASALVAHVVHAHSGCCLSRPARLAPERFFVALVAWFLGSLNMWGVFRNVLQVPLVPVEAFLILPGCFFGLGVLLFRRWVRGGKPAAAAVGFAAFSVMLFAATLAALCWGYGSSREKGVLAVGVAIFLLGSSALGSGVCMRRKKLSGFPRDCCLLTWRRTYFPRNRRTRSA